MWEVEQQICQVQEKAHECGKFWKRLKEKHTKNFGGITLMDMYVHCKDLYKKESVEKRLGNRYGVQPRIVRLQGDQRPPLPQIACTIPFQKCGLDALFFFWQRILFLNFFPGGE